MKRAPQRNIRDREGKVNMKINFNSSKNANREKREE
jgi:hypothetical protein